MSHKDIGDFLEVPEGEREDVDPTPEYNADAGFDIEVVPDGQIVELGSAEDEPVVMGPTSDDGDGAPLHFISTEDPEFDSEDD